jgi:GntR family transcriptional regulator of vanillate catabolism
VNQRALAIVRLRELILNGDLEPGHRLAEATLADRLGISRTPIRQALPVLAQEGLLISHATRGYLVRRFSAAELADAVDLRGILEGTAARTIAERGAPRALIRALREQLDAGDAIFAGGAMGADGEEAYGVMNARFHALIVEGAQRPILLDAIARLQSLPFVAPGTIAFERSNLDKVFGQLSYAHGQHHGVVDALERGEGMRAAALMSEHAHTQRVSMSLFGEDAPADSNLVALGERRSG